jgi:hypothetical protein
VLASEDKYLRIKEYDIQTINLFLPTVYYSCEKEERKKIADGKSDKENLHGYVDVALDKPGYYK